jgi:DNA polymerase-3 subunit epsilon
MSKVLWVDIESTGVDTQKCAIIEVAGIIEIDEEVKEEFSLAMRPGEGALIEQGALEATGRTQESLFVSKIDEKVGKKMLESWFGKYVDKYDKKDKFVMAGYNVRFDSDFLRALWTRQNDPYFGSWFYWPTLDVASFVAEMLASNGSQPKFDNFKLGEVCKVLDIRMGQAHTALEDIKATRRLYQRLRDLH